VETVEDDIHVNEIVGHEISPLVCVELQLAGNNNRFLLSNHLMRIY
jgi:hypothetical protein